MSGVEDALFEDIHTNRCIPFVGAGFSKNAAGKSMPDYVELAQSLARFVDMSEDEAASCPEKVYTAYSTKYGSTKLKEEICRTLEGAKPGEAHRLFVTLGWTHILTTNFDSLLEDALNDADILTDICACERDFSAISDSSRGGKPRIAVVKIHGDCNHRSDMAVDPADLTPQNYERQRPMLTSFLKENLGRKSALFIGYSLRDPNVAFLKKFVEVELHISGGATRNPYIILIDPTEKEFRDYQKDGFIPVPLAATEVGVSPGDAVLDFLRKAKTYCVKRCVEEHTSQQKVASKLAALVVSPRESADRYAGGPFPIEEVAVGHLPNYCSASDKYRVVLIAPAQDLASWISGIAPHLELFGLELIAMPQELLSRLIGDEDGE